MTMQTKLYNLRRQRARSGLTVDDLADRAGLKPEAIELLERGYSATTEAAQRLARALSVKVSSIEGTMHAPGLRSLREDRGLTQAGLAERSGVSRRTIITLELGGYAEVRIVRCLATALGAQIDDLELPEEAKPSELTRRVRSLLEEVSWVDLHDEVLRQRPA